MTADSLNSYTMKDLAQLAKRRGVHGWHSMRKDQLVQALVRAAKSAAAKGKLKQKVAASRRSAVARTPASRPATSNPANSVRRKTTGTNGATAANGAGKSNGAAKTTHAAAAPARKAKSPYAVRRLEQA